MRKNGRICDIKMVTSAKSVQYANKKIAYAKKIRPHMRLKTVAYEPMRRPHIISQFSHIRPFFACLLFLVALCGIFANATATLSEDYVEQRNRIFSAYANLYRPHICAAYATAKIPHYADFSHIMLENFNKGVNGVNRVDSEECWRW